MSLPDYLLDAPSEPERCEIHDDIRPCPGCQWDALNRMIADMNDRKAER